MRNATQPIPADYLPIVIDHAQRLASRGWIDPVADLTRSGRRFGRPGSYAAARLGVQLLTALATSARRCELQRLRQADLRLSTEQPAIYVRSAKGGRDRTVPVALDLVDRILDLRRLAVCRGIESELLFPSRTGGLVDLSHMSKQLAAFGSCFGLKMSWHALRDTAAVRQYIQSGYCLRSVQYTLGHRSIHTTSIYLQKLAPRPQALQWDG